MADRILPLPHPAPLHFAYLPTLRQIRFGSILGSDGCGVVESLSPAAEAQLGASAARAWVGRRVVMDASLGWGGSEVAPDGNLQILGMPADGTFGELVRVPLANLYAAPGHLSDAEAAALPLAAGTAYRALVTKGGVRDHRGDAPTRHAQRGLPTQTVLITGIGGGVAMFALQLGVALGARVIVTSGDDAKLAKAREMGAAAGVNYRAEGWLKTLKKVSELASGASEEGVAG